MGYSTALCIGGLVMVLAHSSKSYAQISPGPLHRSHAFLEAVENCNRCHDRDSDRMRTKCLQCHTEMQSRVEAGKGLHSQSEFRDCENCHVEHHGREFDLIFWKDGEQAFDHSLTGYELRGKHAKTACRDCHRQEFNKELERLLSRQKDFARTYLGLDTNCVSCHLDEHRDQLSRECARCHTFDGWVPAPGFDHGTTKFALTGRHATTACGRCHIKVEDRKSSVDREYLQFAQVRHENCNECHKDAHEGRFGLRCEGCHNTSGWSVSATVGFDHGKTRYPLEGRHKQVACDKCHLPGQPKRGLKFQACRDCHPDRHKGEFADRIRGGDCEECHSVAGFSPARFTIEQHQSTRFALREAHLGVPCNACHGESPGNMSAREGQYTWSSMRCRDCHADVHQGQLGRYVEREGCEYCHSEAAWSTVRFPHDSTAFPLTGKHAVLACASCHRGDTTATDIRRLQFGPLRRDCEICHQDIHRGQFVVADTIPGIRCDRCHTPSGWQATLFDHNTMSGYRLDGAHTKVPCAGCHKPVFADAVAFVDYQIGDHSCRGCHGTDSVRVKGATP